MVYGWRPQPGPQNAYVHCPFPEVFFGGARGGGKTDAVLGKWSIKERKYGPGFNAIMFRRTTTSAEDAIERSKSIYGPLGGKFNEAKLKWRMPNGGRVAFAYLETVKDADAYQGRNVTDAWVEEAGQFPSPAPVDRLFGVLRSSGGVPIQLTLTANPGGAGQHWLRNRYRLHPFPNEPFEIRKVLPDGSTHRTAVIPSRIGDNKILMEGDPGYVSRLYMVGSKALVRAWLKGDWTAVEGAFFSEWSDEQHVIPPFRLPDHWLRFRSGDWGSSSPFSIGWWAVATDDYVMGDRSEQDSRRLGSELRARYDPHGSDLEEYTLERLEALTRAPPPNVEQAKLKGDVIPRGALIRYREWYGASSPGVGLKLTAEEVADGIIDRELRDPKLAYGVLDPANFSSAPHQWGGGPSIAERINNKLIKAKFATFREADNTRVRRVVGDAEKSGPMGGWDALRARLVGTAVRDEAGEVDWSSGRPMLYVFSNCADLIRTMPVMQHDPVRSEDLDTNSEDHAVDEARYAVMSRPWIKVLPPVERPKDGYSPAAVPVNDADSVVCL